MNNDEIEDELRSEEEYQEVKEWEESGSEDDFNTWKLKKYINGRFIFAVIVAVIITLVLIKII